MEVDKAVRRRLVHLQGAAANWKKNPKEELGVSGDWGDEMDSGATTVPAVLLPQLVVLGIHITQEQTAKG